jgi:hypothetical protein
MKIVKIFGPPGTGKTTALVGYVLSLIGKAFYSIYSVFLGVYPFRPLPKPKPSIPKPLEPKPIRPLPIRL